MRSIGGDGDQLQVSASGGTEPAWSSDGGEIFYRSVGGREPMMMVATIGTTPSLAVTVRRTPASRIMVVQNLAELMKR